MPPREPLKKLHSPEDFHGDVVILDANALMAPFQFSFNLDLKLEDIVPGATAIVPTSVIDELEKLASNGDWKVKAALDLSLKYPSVTSKGKGDSSICNLAVDRGWMVMTQDRDLRRRLLNRSITVLFLRGKGRIALMEP